MAMQIRVLKCYVWSTLLYVCEAWSISSVKLEAFETWLYRNFFEHVLRNWKS